MRFANKNMNKVGKVKALKKAGFTLIELLVVISIIALLSSVVLASVNSARQKAQVSKVTSGIEEFVKALEIYRTNYGKYPGCDSFSSENVLVSLTGSANSCFVSYGIPYVTANVDHFTSLITNELQSKKIYSGDFIQLLESTPNLAYIQLEYWSGSYKISNNYAGSYTYQCGSNASLDNYYLRIILVRSGADSTLLGNTSYLSKEYFRHPDGTLAESGYYCIGN